MKKILPFVILILISALLIFYRFSTIPKNLSFDEVEFTKLALSLDKKPYIPYSQLATGHSTLYFYKILGSLKTFGINTFALRFPSAVFGILSALLFYLIIKKIFKQQLLSFLLALTLLSSHWFINFARFSFEATFLLFLELTSIYFILKFDEVIKVTTPFLRNSPGAPMGVWRSKKTMPSFLKNVKPVYVKHLGRQRIPTLFPHLLNEVAKMGFEKVEFMSSNPWDFSDELIDVMAKNKNISRSLHLPVQSGDDAVLKRMNRWYSADEYLVLISKIKAQIPNMKFTTDIIVGFCGETDKEFQSTVDLCKKVGFNWAYVSMYSPRFNTAATKVFKDDVSHITKKKRWLVLENLINQPQLKKSKIH